MIYKTPKDIPPTTTAADWPDRFVARRFEKGKDNLLYPTVDLVAAKTLGDMRRKLPPLQVIPRGPDDHETIVETRLCPHVIPALEGERLSTGMKVQEAMRHARLWWDKKARHAVDVEFNKERDAAKVRAGPGGPVSMIAGDVREVLPSNILRGLPWDVLTIGERFRVMMAWHEEFHAKPQRERVRSHTELLLAGEVKGNA